MSSKKLFPKLRFLEFRDASEWNEVNIGKFLKESKLKGNKGDTAKKLTVKLWGQGVFEKKETQKGSENTQYFRRQAGQFIYSKLDFLNQAFGVIPDCLNGYESTVDLPCFDVSEELDTRFLLEYVKRTDFYKRHGEMADGGRIAKRIQIDTFLSFPIHLPVLFEQQKIADCLTSLDELIVAENAKLDNLKTHKKGLMQKLFPAEGQTVPEWRFGEFTEPWKELKLGDIKDVRDGTHDSPKFYQSGHPLVTSKNLTEAGLDLSNVSLISQEDFEAINKRSKVDVGDIIFGMIGTIGNPVIIARNDFAIKNVALIKGGGEASNYFLLQLLKSPVFDNYVRKENAGNTQKFLGLGKIRDFVFLSPCLKEMDKIGIFLRNLDNVISAQTEKIEALKQHKKGLMQGLFPSAQEVME